jgi:hypothetical protein
MIVSIYPSITFRIISNLFIIYFRVFKNKRRRFVSSLSKVPEGKDPRLHTDSTDSPLKYVLPGGNMVKGKMIVFCGVCNKEMKNSKDLVEHRLQKHDGMKFRCDVCDYLCKRPAELARHRLSRHLLETEGFKSLTCSYDECDFKCLEVSKDMLQKHIGYFIDFNFFLSHFYSW